MFGTLIQERVQALQLLDTPEYRQQLDRLATLVYETMLSGHKVLFAGNGGSAADAQHIAAEYVVRFKGTRRALPAIALTVDTSILTACGNDFGFAEIFSRQIEALGRKGDLLIVHSTSGNSPNLICAVEVARNLGLGVVALLGGDGGLLRELVPNQILVPATSTDVIQELHLAIEHMVCDSVERTLVAKAHVQTYIDLDDHA